MTDEFGVAARARTGTVDREINMALHDAIGAAQSPRGSAAAVDNATLTAATGATTISDFSKAVCNISGSAQACQFEDAAQGDMAVTAIFRAGARALNGRNKMDIESVLHAAVGAEQSSCISAAAQDSRHVPAVHAAGTRQFVGDDDKKFDLHRESSYAQSGDGIAGLCQDLVVPGGGTAGARVISVSDDREINALLREAMESVQNDAGSSYSHDTEENRDCPYARHELAHPCTSKWQGSTSAAYTGMAGLCKSPCDKVAVGAQAALAAAVSEVLARRTSSNIDSVLPNEEQFTAAKALLKAAEEIAALPAPVCSGQPQKNTDNAQRLPETAEVDLIGAAYAPTSYLQFQLPSNSAAAADHLNIDASLAVDFAFLGINPKDAHAASLSLPGDMGRPDWATSNDSTAAALHVAGHEHGTVGDAIWCEVLLSESLNDTKTSYKLDQLLQQPGRQHGSAEANNGWANHEPVTSPIPAGALCGHERPSSRLGSAQRVLHQRAMAQRQRKERSTAVQQPGTCCGGRECHGWDNSPLLRRAAPRPRSHGWWHGEGLSGSPYRKTALDWLHAQAATLHDAWPASGSSCPAPCSRPQTAAPQRRRVAAPEEVPAVGPLIGDGTSSCGGVLAGRLTGFGSAPQQCFDAYQPLSGSKGARGWGSCGLNSRTGSSPRPGCAPRRSALSAHKGPPAQTDRVVRHQRMQEAWARDPFLCSGAAGANAAGKRKMLGFAEAFAEVHAANDQMRRLYLQLTAV